MTATINTTPAARRAQTGKWFRRRGVLAELASVAEGVGSLLGMLPSFSVTN